jgi:hypothetical protein
LVAANYLDELLILINKKMKKKLTFNQVLDLCIQAVEEANQKKEC